MIANIEGLVVVIGVLVVNELHHSCWMPRGKGRKKNSGYQDNVKNTDDSPSFYSKYRTLWESKEEGVSFD